MGSQKPPGSRKSTKSATAEAIPQLLSWFEIPAVNFHRAVAFYNHLYGVELETSEVNNYLMAIFPHQAGAGGAVVCGEGSVPSEQGPLLYLNAGNQLDSFLDKIEEAGGKVILGKTFISEQSGHFAVFMDTEGNKLALHSK